MPFFNSQLGRFGDIGAMLTSIVDPDQRAADLLAVNGRFIGSRPTLHQVLAAKGFWDPADPSWISWQLTFANLRNQ